MELKTNIALFHRFNMYAVVAVATTAEKGIVSRSDPRDAHATSVLCDKPEDAYELFGTSITTSVNNGWRLFHLGKPNWG